MNNYVKCQLAWDSLHPPDCMEDFEKACSECKTIPCKCEESVDE